MDDELRGLLSTLLTAVESNAAETMALRAEMKAGFAALRAEMRAGDSALRAEMKAGDAAVREEMKTLETTLRDEMRTLETTLREEMRAGFTQQGERFADQAVKTARLDGRLEEQSRSIQMLFASGLPRRPAA